MPNFAKIGATSKPYFGALSNCNTAFDATCLQAVKSQKYRKQSGSRGVSPKEREKTALYSCYKGMNGERHC